MKMSCDQIRNLMGPHLGSELPGAQRGEVDHHLSTCPACQRLWREAQEILSDLREECSVVAMPGLRSQVQGILADAWARTEEAESLGEIVMVDGEVKHRRQGSRIWDAAKRGESMASGDALEVGRGARAMVRLPDRSELWLNAGTLMRLGRRAAATAVQLVRGEVLALMERQRQAFQVLTDDGAVEVVGTVFNTRTDPGEGTWVSVLRGRVRVTVGSRHTEVGQRRRVRMSDQRGLSRMGRLSAAEMRRLGGWAGPLRSASRAGEEHTLDTVRKETMMSALKRLLGTAAVVVLALFAFNLWKSSGPASVEEVIRGTQSRIAQTQHIEVTEPITLNLIPSPGDTWRQTTIMRGQEMNRDSVSEARTFDMEVRFISESHARSGDSPGQVTVEHTITDMDFAVDMSEWPEPMHQQMETIIRERESSFMRAVIRESLDAQGGRVETEISIPDVPPHSITGSELAAFSFMTPPADTGGQPLTVGTTWTQVDHIPCLPGVPIYATSTLDHLEEIDAERVAVVCSEVNLHFDAARDGPIELGVQSDPREGTGVFVLETLDFTFTGEDRHSLTGGRRILTTGHVEASGQIRVFMTWRSGQGDVIDFFFAEDFDVVTEIEPL